jgi:hypothetical protein
MAKTRKQHHKHKNKHNYTNSKSKRKYPKVCTPDMTFEDCEVAILRDAVDKAEHFQGESMVKDPEIKKLIEIVEEFIRKKKLICYGGTAINNLLPEEDRFYNLEVELPDYDVYSSNGMRDAIELADLYYKHGYKEIEAKSGMHEGTFKVFVNFVPIADITTLDKELFNSISKDALMVAGLRYTPINYLRMSMYKELSRPEGDISRWEKVMKRLALLNKNYPLRGKDCDGMEIQRVFDERSKLSDDDIKKIFTISRDSFINQGVVFFGAVANRLYLKHYKNNHRTLKEIPDFDILAQDPKLCATILKDRLKNEGYKNIEFRVHKNAGEVVPEHIEILVENDTIAFIYKASDCHSYNTITLHGRKMKIASIDTMLNMYLAFLYLDRPYYNKERIICMSEFLYKVQQMNRLQQKGILRRFSIECYGKPTTIQAIKSRRNTLHKELKKDRFSKEYIKHFMRYIPGTKQGSKIKIASRKQKKIKSKRETRKIMKRIKKFVGL